MILTNVKRIIIDEFKIFGDDAYPGCSSRADNKKIYKMIKEQLLLRQAVHMSVSEIEREWKRMKRWWVNHQRTVRHRSYRGERCGYECPDNFEACKRMAFISVCDCFRDLFEKQRAAFIQDVEEPPAIETIILD